MKSISLIIRPIEEAEGDREELTPAQLLSSSAGDTKGLRKLGERSEPLLGTDFKTHDLPRTKVEVVVPEERADDILKAIVDTIYATQTANRPEQSPGSFEALLEEHIAKVLRLMEGAGDCRLHERVIRMVEKSLLRIVLRRTEGNQVQAARILGIHRNTLREKLKEIGLKPGRPPFSPKR